MRKIGERMAVNLFEIVFFTIMFFWFREMTDIILYQNEIQVDKLRVNYHQRHLDTEWDSFKLKIVNPTAAAEVFNVCQNLNFALTKQD